MFVKAHSTLCTEDRVHQCTPLPLHGLLHRCGDCRRYMKVIEGVPQRLLCESCNKFFSLPARGNIKPYEVRSERQHVCNLQCWCDWQIDDVCSWCGLACLWYRMLGCVVLLGPYWAAVQYSNIVGIPHMSHSYTYIH